jgi:outer membrane protein assembly factor BamB
MDCNPAHYWKDEAGNPRKYTSYDGPSETIATPVFADGMVFFAIGQDPEHGPGVGRLQAVVPWATGETKPVWTFDGIGRTISTVAVAGGLVYAADYEGRVYCVDEKTGALQWKYDTKAHIWGSLLVAGDYVMIGDEDGVFHILGTGRELVQVAAISLPAPIYSTPILANGVLYVATQTHLYAIDGK